MPNPNHLPICFVAMPFGKKPDLGGGEIDFDAVYAQLIRPSIEAAGLEALRADEELHGGFIHKAMFERLILSEFTVADLTTANANVFYELGIRHAVRPATTVLVYAAGRRLPFDLGPIRALPYRLDDFGRPAALDPDRAQLTTALRHAISSAGQPPDSPVFQLVEGWRPGELAHAKTDVFRDRVSYANDIKTRLAAARKEGADSVRRIEEKLGRIELAESGIAVDLLLSYRACKAWQEMVGLVGKMPAPLAGTVLVQEQLAFALNRLGQRDRAQDVLEAVLKTHGPSSETFGLLGRVYKDRYDDALAANEEPLARGYLRKAIESYLAGFQADWRDAYPGINALTLMTIQHPADPRREELLPVVRYAVQRRIDTGKADYWDHATLLELRVLAEERVAADEALTDALAAVRELWEPETTARNLGLLRKAFAKQSKSTDWIERLEAELLAKATPAQ